LLQNAVGPGLAAVVWDSSEDLRDREGAGFESILATSRIAIGAVCHEIRNLASAASVAYSGLAGPERIAAHDGYDGYYDTLGTLIRGLEKVASCGLRATSPKALSVVDVEMVLDETRIVIEPSLREAGIAVTWDVDAPRFAIGEKAIGECNGRSAGVLAVSSAHRAAAGTR
jgi:hypothetical protein